MIRINLLHGRWQEQLRGMPWLYVPIGLGLAAVLGALYWAGQNYLLHGPRAELIADVDRQGAAEDEGEVRKQRQKIVETERLVPQRQVERLARSRPGVRAAVRQVGAKEVVRKEVVQGSVHPGGAGNGSLPRWSPACTQVLEICKYLPATIQLRLLSGDASGDYFIEGLSRSSERAFADFKDVMDKFSGLEAQSQPTVRREGKGQNGWVYKLVFRGRFEVDKTRRLKPISPSEAKYLFREISSWAKQSGLREFTSEGPLQKDLQGPLVKQRKKIWAKGSPQEFRKFIDELGQVQENATLGEFRMVPIYRQDDSWENARFYAAVDVLVQ